MSDVHYLTADGLKRLKDELENLKGPGREDLSRRLRAAIQMGDLSENADYIQAKEEQGFLEGRIQELTAILSNVVIIEENLANREKVDIGARVTIQEEGFDDLETYQVVGPKEADPRNNHISYESPIGRALLGKKIGELAIADTPNGQFIFKIVSID